MLLQVIRYVTAICLRFVWKWLELFKMHVTGYNYDSLLKQCKTSVQRFVTLIRQYRTCIYVTVLTRLTSRQVIASWFSLEKDAILATVCFRSLTFGGTVACKTKLFVSKFVCFIRPSHRLLTQLTKSVKLLNLCKLLSSDGSVTYCDVS
jgi:hypothetical protein